MRRSNLRLRIIAFLLIALTAIALGIQSPWFGRIVYPWRYRDEISQFAAKYGVDPYLVAAIAYTESRFNPYAQSPKGAVGLMQLMPDTATWIAEQLRWQSLTVEQLTDPAINIELGCWYLANLSSEFDELPQILAAYNAGRGNLQKWLSQGIWEGDLQSVDRIPFGETRDYVRKVTRYYGYYRNLYGPKVVWFWWR